MRISLFSFGLALCWATLLGLVPHAVHGAVHSSLIPPPPPPPPSFSSTPPPPPPSSSVPPPPTTGASPSLGTTPPALPSTYSGIVVATNSYKPTVGVETELNIMKTFCTSGGVKKNVKHEDVVAESPAKSPIVPTLPLSYIQVDGAHSDKDGHFEFTLGPHSLEQLKVGLADQQSLIRVLNSEPAGVHPVEEVLKKVTHAPPNYQLNMIMTKCKSPARWEYQSKGSDADRNVDTQITYSFPLGKVTSEAFAKMPRGTAGEGSNKFLAAKAFAEEVITAYPELRGDLEVAGLLTLFFQFAAARLVCNPNNGVVLDGCLKNWDGQQVKADLWTLSNYLRHSNPHYAAFADKHLNDKAIRNALITRYRTFLMDKKNHAVNNPDETFVMIISKLFKGHMRHLLFLLFAPDDRYAKACSTARGVAIDFMNKEANSKTAVPSPEFKMEVRERLLGQYKTAKEYEEAIFGTHLRRSVLQRSVPPFAPFAFKHIWVENVACTLTISTKVMPSTLVTVGDKKHLYILVESRYTSGELTQRTFTNKAFAPVSSVNFAALDGDHKRHWDFLAALQQP